MYVPSMLNIIGTLVKHWYRAFSDSEISEEHLSGFSLKFNIVLTTKPRFNVMITASKPA